MVTVINTTTTSIITTVYRTFMAMVKVDNIVTAIVTVTSNTLSIYCDSQCNNHCDLRTVPTIVIAHTFCASRDTRVSYR